MKISKHSINQKNLFGERARRLRLKKGLSQRALAAQFQLEGYDFTDLTILRIERGLRLATDIELKAYCLFFKVSANLMLGLPMDWGEENPDPY